MEQTKWVDRKFSFDYQDNTFPSIIERLMETPLKLSKQIKSIPYEIQTLRFENTWSIKENIGHLTDLEELWQGRLTDFLEEKEELRAWDITNRKTRKARHNKSTITDLVIAFGEARSQTIAALRKLEESDYFRIALHPRLKQPMRLMDLFWFVAEHDDHHLNRVAFLLELFNNESLK